MHIVFSITLLIICLDLLLVTLSKLNLLFITCILGYKTNYQHNNSAKTFINKIYKFIRADVIKKQSLYSSKKTQVTISHISLLLSCLRSLLHHILKFYNYQSTSFLVFHTSSTRFLFLIFLSVSSLQLFHNLPCLLYTSRCV